MSDHVIRQLDLLGWRLECKVWMEWKIWMRSRNPFRSEVWCARRAIDSALAGITAWTNLHVAAESNFITAHPAAERYDAIPVGALALERNRVPVNPAVVNRSG